MPDDVRLYEPPIPEAVKRASARADQLAREAGVTGVPDKEGAATTTVVSEAEPSRSDRSERAARPERAAAEAKPAQETQNQGQNQGQTPDHQGQTPDRSEPGSEEWRQRYLTLQGKYDREVPELSGRVRQLDAQIVSLQQLLANLSAQPREAPAQGRAGDNRSLTADIPPEDLENYGEDLITASRRWARRDMQPELDQLKQQLAELKGTTQRTQTSVAQNAVERHLDANVPNWRATNDDPAFLSWLRGVDPFSGRVRHDMLGEAYVGGDAARTASFFHAFTTEHTAVSPASRPEPAHTPDAGAGRPSLESLAAPGRAKTSGSNGAPSEKRIWTRNDITAFYRDVNRGAFEGRDAERARLEADLVKATTEGRVR